MNSQPAEINVILCQGRKTDGTQCKAEIQKKSKFCGKCDPQGFSSTVITCHGQREDGSICGNICDDEDEYCTMCGPERPRTNGTNGKKENTAADIKGEERTQKESYERGNRSEEHDANVRTTVEAVQGRLQEENSTVRNISSSQNQDNETLELVISDLQLMKIWNKVTLLNNRVMTRMVQIKFQNHL